MDAPSNPIVAIPLAAVAAKPRRVIFWSSMMFPVCFKRDGTTALAHTLKQ
jgi:hypothetical protein